MPVRLNDLTGEGRPQLDIIKIVDGQKVRRRLSVECPDGSTFPIPKSWVGQDWYEWDDLRTAIQYCRWLDEFAFDDHLVLTYAPTSYGKSFGEWKGEFIANGNLVASARAYMTMIEKNTRHGPTRPSTARSHLNIFLTDLRHLIAKKKLWYLAVIETFPRMHIHLLTRNTQMLSTQDFRSIWNKGLVSFGEVDDAEHRRNTVRYLHKTYGAPGQDVRFDMMVPTNVLG